MVFSHWTIIHCLFTYMNCMYRSQLRIWRVWRYQRCHQNAYMEEEQTTQWSKEKVQKKKLRSTNHTHTYIMTHILFYILWHMSYDAKYMTCLTLQNAYIFITQSYLMLYIIWHMFYVIYIIWHMFYVIYYMTHVVCYISYDTCFMLYIYDSYLLVFRSTHSSE